MSDSLAIKYSPSAGRHAVATDDISPGEIILIEQPIAWTVNPNQSSSVCQNCSRQVCSLIIIIDSILIFIFFRWAELLSPAQSTKQPCSAVIPVYRSLKRPSPSMTTFPLLNCLLLGLQRAQHLSCWLSGALFRNLLLGTINMPPPCFPPTMLSMGRRRKRGGSLREMRTFTRLFIIWSITLINWLLTKN